MLEIERLDGMLEEAEIPFERADDCQGYISFRRIKYPSRRKNIFSVIQGYGSYGYEDNLLEVSYCGAEPQGYQTAEQVFERIKNHYERSKGNEKYRTILARNFK